MMEGASSLISCELPSSGGNYCQEKTWAEMIATSRLLLKRSFLFGAIVILMVMYNMQPITKISKKHHLKQTIIPNNGTEDINTSTGPPIVVAWTTFYRRPLSMPLQPLNSCSFKCFLVNRTELLTYNRKPSAFIIHGCNIDLSDLPEANANQLKIMMMLESPNYAGGVLAQLPEDYFNATISYRKDSRYFHPYGRFEPISSTTPSEKIITSEQVHRSVKAKSQGSLIFITHCESPSKRGKIIQALGHFTNITVAGYCGGAWKKKYKRNTSFQMPSENKTDQELIESHRFYLSFENGICRDYVTEKYYWRMSQLLVPIVLKRKILEDLGLPSDSFIAVDDFKNLKQLGDYLNSLSIDDNAYLRYFEWTKKYTNPAKWHRNSFCMLCKDIYERTKMIDKNIARFYNTEECNNESNELY